LSHDLNPFYSTEHVQTADTVPCAQNISAAFPLLTAVTTALPRIWLSYNRNILYSFTVCRS